jgi:hypothetical protein
LSFFSSSEPPEPESVDQVAKKVEQQYDTVAKRLIERPEAVVSGLAEGITKGEGFIGKIKELLIKAIGIYFAMRFGESK